MIINGDPLGVLMNEFTKDELLIIHLGIITEINKYEGILKPSPMMLKLRDKIEAMIEGYCEHEWHSGGNRPWLHCIKCKSNFHHERAVP